VAGPARRRGRPLAGRCRHPGGGRGGRARRRPLAGAGGGLPRGPGQHRPAGAAGRSRVGRGGAARRAARLRRRPRPRRRGRAGLPRVQLAAPLGAGLAGLRGPAPPRPRRRRAPVSRPRWGTAVHCHPAAPPRS
jgi:hypothetical protein